MTVPDWWEFLLLAAASWRTWTLAAADTILDPVRDRVLPGRPGLISWLECPYCAGFWSAVAWWAAWEWTDATLIAAVPFALSTAVIGVEAVVSRLGSDGE